MKNKKLQTKRKVKSGLRALYAKTLAHKQEAFSAAVSPEEIEGDIPKVGMRRALTVILILHIAAIVAICIGTNWKGPEEKGSNAITTLGEKGADTSSVSGSGKQHRFSVDQPPSYRNAEVTNSLDSVIPPPRQVHTPSVQQDSGRELRVIRPMRNPNAYVHQPQRQSRANAQSRYKVYTIAAGDTIYRLAQRNKVKQQAILDFNNIADARKIRPGMKIKIPVK